MRILLPAAAFLVTVCACQSVDRVPNGILPRQKMEDVMWDLIRTAEFLDNYVLPRDTLANKREIISKWYEKIYFIHHTSGEEFRKSFDYYREHPKLLRDILDTLATRQVFIKPFREVDSVASMENQSTYPGKSSNNPDQDVKKAIEDFRNRNLLKKENAP